jgi:membrane protease YdiL (CAAX protease family)
MSFSDLLRNLFLTPGEPRLRAGWRLLAQFIMMIATTFIIVIPGSILVFAFPAFQEAILLAIGGGAIVVSVFAARKWIDRRSITSMGLRWDNQARRDLFWGIGIAFLQIALMFMLQWAFGWLEVGGFAWEEQPAASVAGSILLWLALFSAVGFYEELLSRGYQLQNLEEGLNTFWAVVLSSAAFGVAHALNPNSSWVSVLAICIAGFFLAYPYLRTRQLWLSIGLHFSWNFFLGPIFGFPVSGITSFTLLQVEISGPDLFTGGAFGPEAGLVVLPAQALGFLIVWAATRGRLTQ